MTGPDPGLVPSGARTITFVVDAGHTIAFVFIICLALEIFLVFMDMTINWLRWSETGAIRRLFNITREDGLASLFGVILTTVVAVTAWLIYLVKRRLENNRHQRLGWLLLALFFTYMVIDDGAMIHERLGTAFDSATDVELPSYAWQFFIAPAFIIAGFFMFVFLWRELPQTKSRIAIAAAISCLALAVALDFLEGMENGYALLIAWFDWELDTVKHFSRSIEEFLEMLAMTTLLVTFLSCLSSLSRSFELRIADEPTALPHNASSSEPVVGQVGGK